MKQEPPIKPLNIYQTINDIWLKIYYWEMNIIVIRIENILLYNKAEFHKYVVPLKLQVRMAKLHYIYGRKAFFVLSNPLIIYITLLGKSMYD